ncbi:hypothetical protein GCM10023186_25700 [Hymenobacter koreensis]|uniref:histidine kinase n=2 Tax=Hymenobacter koreensis TaxID=1084523 RepID=A0ABP8J2T1_9BACT
MAPRNFAPDGFSQTLLDVSLTAFMLLRPNTESGSQGPADFTVEYLNPAGQRMLGLPERPPQSFRTYFPSTEETGVMDFYRHMYKTGQAGCHAVNYQYDGLDNYFRISAQRHGELLVVSFTDTADQNRTPVEEALRESQARERAALAEAETQRQQLQELFRNVPAYIAKLEGPELRYTMINPLLQRLIGKRDVIGLPIRDALPEIEGQPFFDMLEEVLRTGEAIYGSEQVAYLDIEGTGRLEPRYFNFVYQPIQDGAANVTGVLIFAYDVSEQVEARQHVQNLNEELAAANEELYAANEEFLSNNAELQSAQQELQILNQELEIRVTQRTHEAQQARAEAELQRANLERLFMQAPAAICILSGPDLVFDLVNPAYQRLLPGRRLLGRPFLEAVPELAQHSSVEVFRRIFRTGITHEELGMHVPVVRTEDGVLEDRYFNYVQQPRFDEEGHIDGVLVFAFEVTEQVQARQASDASAQQLRLLTDALPVLIGYLDKEQKYQFANHAYEAWFNQKPSALLGRPVREVVGEEAYSAVLKYIEGALAGQRQDFEARMPYREGFTKYIHTSYIPEIRNGEVAGFYTLVTDITEQVEARQYVAETNEQLRRSNAELDALNQQLSHTNIDLDNFIYSASHDLKAPITNIEGLLDVLERQLPDSVLNDPEVAPVLTMMQDSVDRFKRTIDYLSDVTKLQKEHEQLPIDIRLADVIDDVCQDLQPLIAETGAQVEVDVSRCPSVSFSLRNLRSVVYNLLSNALKYRHPNRAPLVRIYCREEGQYTVLSVQDNGLGLEPHQHAQLFTMFRRLHSHVEGSGVGLYMVKRSVENAGGKVSVESELGAGSVFSVYFPR